MISKMLYFDIHELTLFSISLRLFLAVIIGGVIGLERGASKHPAGFRTHILVCMSAALAMLTNQYMYDYFGGLADPGRLGAQVITGVGFLGVGTILVTGRHKIKGLTTAAGLWASACIGLALGIGFYSGAIFAGILVFISLSLLTKIETCFYVHSRTMGVYVEIDSLSNFKSFISKIKEEGLSITETHVARSIIHIDGAIAVHFFLKLPKHMNKNDAIEFLNSIPYLLIVEEE